MLIHLSRRLLTRLSSVFELSLKRKRAHHARRSNVRLRLESLEDRLAPATLSDGGTAALSVDQWGMEGHSVAIRAADRRPVLGANGRPTFPLIARLEERASEEHSHPLDPHWKTEQAKEEGYLTHRAADFSAAVALSVRSSSG